MTVLQALKRIPDGLFWSAPLASDSDFSAEDPLALDYLGQQVGLWLFRGFTTRTSRAQNYAVVLYGLDLADKAIRRFGYPGDDETRVRLFERWERFWALATLEHRSGQLSRGDADAMRGVRGATRAWFPGDKPLPTDFALISRQSELGGLGAYLSSLREYGLVFPGSLRITPAASAILDSFWSEKGERDTKGTYEDYAIQALNFDTRKTPRSHGRLSLSGLGARSCLSSIASRREQQQRLWNALFVGARDGSTLPLAECLIAAHRDRVTDPERLLKGMMAGQWQTLTKDHKDKVKVALLFGQIARLLLQRFNRAYGHVHEHGWVADFKETANASFPDFEANELRQACTAMLDAEESKRFKALQFHGPDFLTLLKRLVSSPSTDSLGHMLEFHRVVQRSRRGGGAWLRNEQGKIVMQVAGYSGHTAEAGFPPLKLNVVRQLLDDLGKLQ
ncbi:conserved protein of unknown function [Burkholderia multivorans]